MDGFVFVVALSIRSEKIHGTWPTRRDVDRYVPKRSFQVHAHRYVRYVSIRGALYRIRYVPAAGVAVTESFGQALTWAPPLLPGPCPEVALHRTKSHPTPGALVSNKQIPPLHFPAPLSSPVHRSADDPGSNSLGRGTRTALLLRQNTSPKYHLSSFPVQRYLWCPNPTKPGTASITFTSRLPLPTVYYCPSSPFLLLSTTTTSTTTTSPYRRNLLRPVCPRNSPNIRRPLHLEHPPLPPRTFSPSVPAQPRSSPQASSRIDL